MEKQGRLLAIDYGARNIGLACSDELRLLAQPLPSIPNAGRKELVRKLKAVIVELDIREALLGMPLNMDGTRGESVLKREQVLEDLKKDLKIPLTGVDERLSTIEALEIWQTMNPRQKKRYRSVDSLAAALILERYLKER